MQCQAPHCHPRRLHHRIHRDRTRRHRCPHMKSHPTHLRNLTRRCQEVQASLQPLDSRRARQTFGKLNNLSPRLLNLTTSSLTPDVRVLTPSMSFELLNKDVAMLVHNAGYGLASGFLRSNNISISEGVQEHAQIEQGISVSPITGQRMDRKERVESKPMM